MRFFVASYLTCLFMSVTFFAILIPLPVAYAQDCLPDVANTPSPVATPQPSNPSVVINEVLMLPDRASLHCNSSTKTSSGPWVELYNPSAFSIQLEHAILDSGANTNYFTIPATTIPTHGFVVVFPSANSNFINTSSLDLRLLFNGAVLDELTVPSTLTVDTSYARIPDGSSSLKVTANTTLGISNNVTLATATAHTQKTTTSKTKSKTPKPVATTYVSNSPAAQTPSLTPSSAPPSSTAKAKVLPIQPNWKVVRLPTHVATSTSSEPTTPGLPATIAPIASSPDTLKKIVLSLLTIALASTLWWCRKLFIKA